ncbi:MAG: RHS repeat-associated core domain-containing protein, partial [Actinobacteria bacterium]|nr:RHS repeat-associated core domain-containing protein [Actinomycetota bacterium]
VVDLTYPDGAQARYTHDKVGRIAQMSVRGSPSGTFLPFAQYTYDDDGGQTGEWLYAAGGSGRTWSLDGVGRVVGFVENMKKPDGTWDSYTATVGDRLDGRIGSLRRNGGPATAYGYDNAGQLTGASGPAGSTAWVYGTRGNRLTQTTDGVTTAYTTNPDGSVASATTGATSTVYGYDPQGRRTTATTTTGGTTSKATTWGYDTRGRAAAVTTTGTGGSATEGRVYDGDGLLTQLRVTDAAGAVSVYEYSWDRTRGVPQIVDSKINNWTWVRSDIANERTDYKQNFYPNWYKYDELGSAIQSAGNTNAADAPVGYDPWGNPASVPAGSTWFGYRGELTIGATVYLRNRDYDPTAGTFLTPDPLDGIDGTPTVANAYHYTNNDPLSRTDPLGMRPTDGALSAGTVGGACSSVGGKLVWWGDTGSRVCMEPGIGEGSSCWPPESPGGDPIVMHQGSCAVKTVEITCARGPSLFDSVCRNSDTIIAGLTVVAVLALGVATGGLAYAAVVSVGGSAGIAIPTGGGLLSLAGGGTLSAGGAIILSPAAAGVLAGTATIAGLGSLSLMAQSSGRPGNVPNRAHQQKQFEDAWRDCQQQVGRMTRAERRILHDAITKQGVGGYREILTECIELFG